MKNLFTIIILISSIIFSQDYTHLDSIRLIHPLNDTFFNSHVRSIKVFNKDTFYIAASDSVAYFIKTENGGSTFTTIKIPDLDPRRDSSSIDRDNNLFSMAVLSKNNIIAVGKRTVHKSSDGGINWRKVADINMFTNSGGKYMLQSTDNNNGYISYSYNDSLVILSTIDAGETWSIKNQLNFNTAFYLPASKNIFDIYFANKDIGYLIFENGLPPHKSTDGGISWFPIDTASYQVTWKYGHFRNIWARNVDTVYTMGGFSANLEPQVRKSTDGGLTWHRSRRVLAPQKLRVTNRGALVGLADHNLSYNYGDTIWYSQSNIQEITDFDLKDSILIAGGYNGVLYARIVPKYISGPTSVKDELNTVNNFNLYQNYPNPFNPTTTIKFNLPERGLVSLRVINIMGEEVFYLNKEMESGLYSMDFNGEGLTSGVYFYTLMSGKFKETKKMLLLK